MFTATLIRRIPALRLLYTLVLLHATEHKAHALRPVQ
jgi:hypothetical protein